MQFEQVGYRPSVWQRSYHALPHDEALGAGSAGPGKTECLIMDPLFQLQVEHARCLRKPVEGWSDSLNEMILNNPLSWGESYGWALHLRRTMPMLDQTIDHRAKRIFPILDPSVKFDAERNTFHFRCGYRIQFGHCRDPDDWEKYFSNQYTHIAFDELVQFEQEQYDNIRGRLRTRDPILRKMLKVRSMSNPVIRRQKEDTFRVLDPFWVRKRFVDPCPDGKKTLFKRLERRSGEVIHATRIYLPAKLWDHPDPDYVADYEAKLLDQPPHKRRALLEGDWYTSPDSYFGDMWDPRIHTCNPFFIPDTWPRFRSMDWGYKKPGCIHWWAMDEEGNLFCEKELTFKGLEVYEVVKLIREIETGLGLWGAEGSRISGPADDQIYEMRGDSAKSKAQKFAELGVSWTGADKKNRSAAAQRVAERLRDHHEGATTPGLVFFKNCRRVIQTLPAIQETPGDPDVPMDGGEDHWYDSVCYACSFASHGRDCIPYVPARFDEWERHRVAPKRNLGRYGYGSSVM